MPAGALARCAVGFLRPALAPCIPVRGMLYMTVVFKHSGPIPHTIACGIGGVQALARFVEFLHGCRT